MLRGMLTLTLSLGLAAAATPAALAQTAAPITEQEAHAIAVDAYVYFYSLVTMDVTRKQFTNVEPGKEIRQGPNEHVRQRPANIRRPTSRVSSVPISTRCIRSLGST